MHATDHIALVQAEDFVNGDAIPIFQEMGPKGIAQVVEGIIDVIVTETVTEEKFTDPETGEVDYHKIDAIQDAVDGFTEVANTIIWSLMEHEPQEQVFTQD